jgi:hypothetical protein
MSEEQLWGKQVWDSPASYKAFKEYFLPAPAGPGRLLKAYLTYWREQGNGKKTGTENPPTKPPGSWLNWYYARDGKGKTIPSAVGWAERASAFDAEVTRLELKKLAEAKAKNKEKRVRVLEGALAQATIVWSQLDFRPRLVDGKLVVPELPSFRDAANGLRIIAEQLRIEYDDLPKNRVEVTGQDGQPLNPAVVSPYAQLSDEELLERLAELDAKRAGRVPSSARDMATENRSETANPTTDQQE